MSNSLYYKFDAAGESISDTHPMPVAMAAAPTPPTGSTTATQVRGTSPSGSADAGANPVKVGGVVQSTATVYANGNLADLRLDTSGNSCVRLMGTVTTAVDGSPNALAYASNQNGLTANILAVGASVLNPAGTWDRQRGDASGTWTKAAPQAGTDRSITATTTSQQAMAANVLRSRLIIKNDSAVDVWINLGATAIATAGGGNIKIANGGGYLELASYSGIVNIIAASATAAITIREFS